MARRRLDAAQSRTLILDAVERLMQRKGYSAVNTRSVAVEAGVKPPLVHYHFDTTENLLLASYRRSAARSETMLVEALQSSFPLHALWDFNSDPVRTALATQFLALAAERKPIADEMARNVEKFRELQISAVAQAMSSTPAGSGWQPDVLAMLLAALGRAMVMESSIGVSAAHANTRKFVSQLLASLEPNRL